MKLHVRDQYARILYPKFALAALRFQFKVDGQCIVHDLCGARRRELNAHHLRVRKVH